MPLAIQQPEWMDLKTLTSYACVSERTLREWIHAVENPLPASQRGNKILVRKRDFDAWMESQRVKSSASIGRIVDDVVSSLTGASH